MKEQIASVVGTIVLVILGMACAEWGRARKKEEPKSSRVSPDGWYTDPNTGYRHPERRSEVFDFKARMK